ncbi:YpoC family protein [Neobacillus niacini]|uniref:YpoC family protein n=1 Tax=Neobacillus niacini TaxID=86668 RepID=UPI0039837512
MDNQPLISLLEELDLVVPYETENEVTSFLLTQWKLLKEELETLYRNRDQKTTKEGMKKGIGLFIHFLYWSNDIQIKSNALKPLDSLDLKPVNLDERLGFVVRRPNLFHSYRQLSELMTEQEKILAKKNIVKKRLDLKG